MTTKSSAGSRSGEEQAQGQSAPSKRTGRSSGRNFERPKARFFGEEIVTTGSLAGRSEAGRAQGQPPPKRTQPQKPPQSPKPTKQPQPQPQQRAESTRGRSSGRPKARTGAAVAAPSPAEAKTVEGHLQGHPRGFAFLLTAAEEKDIFIAAPDMHGAVHDDLVVVRLRPGGKTPDRPEGEVVKILERGTSQLVGVFQGTTAGGVVIPDDPRIAVNLLIPKGATAEASSGDKVVAAVTRWPQDYGSPEGKVSEVLGAKGSPGVDVLSIIRKFDLPESFPKRILKEARQVEQTVSADQTTGRFDLRHLPIVTIDGEDARDLDDAVSVERLAGGTYLLGVHIADVAHYVQEGTPLDQEALRRGTSVYLVDRVIPMLPPELSNGICSLNPQVDRLTKTVFMEFDDSGRRLGYALVKSVIRTCERMSYKGVRLILEGTDQEPKYDYLREQFAVMEELTTILRRRRMARGSLDFDLPECKVGLDEEGRPVDLYRYPRSIADIIIEEFMLAANETVARHLSRVDLPGIYRVHEDPDPERIAALEASLAVLGFPLQHRGKPTPLMFQDLLERIKDRPEERMINTLVLRSMKRARYASAPLGHFGLAARYYLHFTSPIRRYPDLVVHRVLEETLPPAGYFYPEDWVLIPRIAALCPEQGERPQTPEQIKRREQFVARLREQAGEIAEQTSQREQVADEAERESVDMKKVEYMLQHLGDTFPGIISGITQFGIFVELENLVEGLIRIATIEDDYYEYNEAPPSLLGVRTGRRFRIGDPIQVQVARVSVDDRQIDFALVKTAVEGGEQGGRKRRQRPGKGRPKDRRRKPQGEA